MLSPRLLLALAGFLVSACLVDAAPSVQTLNPADGSTVTALTSVAVTFSEAVAGVDAEDLLINGDTALTVSGSGAGPYTFTFSQPLPGTIGVEFTGDHGIVGLANTGLLVPPLPWSYTLADAIAPTAIKVTPAPGATLGTLTN